MIDILNRLKSLSDQKQTPKQQCPSTGRTWVQGKIQCQHKLNVKAQFKVNIQIKSRSCREELMQSFIFRYIELFYEGGY